MTRGLAVLTACPCCGGAGKVSFESLLVPGPPVVRFCPLCFGGGGVVDVAPAAAGTPVSVARYAGTP